MARNYFAPPIPPPQDTYAETFPLVLMGAEWRVKRAQTRERGPPLATAKIAIVINNKLLLLSIRPLNLVIIQKVNPNLENFNLSICLGLNKLFSL